MSTYFYATKRGNHLFCGLYFVLKLLHFFLENELVTEKMMFFKLFSVIE